MKKINFNITQKSINKFKNKFLGLQATDGILIKTIVYLLLITIGYIYVYPLLRMFSKSFMSIQDVINPGVNWLPSTPTLSNYKSALEILNLKVSLVNSIWLSAILAILQTLSSAFVGYGFARFNFRFKKLLMVMLLATFIIPQQVTLIPKFMLFSQYNMVGTVFPLLILALFGQGLNATIFILIFYNFFMSIPKVIEEAAQIDGINFFNIFIQIILRISAPIMAVVFLFSFVWNWNETYFLTLITNGNFTTLPIQLAGFVEAYTKLFGQNKDALKMNDGLRMAGTLITIIPLLILYLFVQKQFVTGVEKSGITGE